MLWGWTGYAQANPDGTTRFWAPNQPRMIMHYPSGDAVVELIPESSKLNINTANPGELARVATSVSGDPALGRAIADAIVDWRSPGPTPFGFVLFRPWPDFPGPARVL